MQMPQRDVIALGQQFLRHGARAAEVDGALAVRNRAARHEKMPHEHGGQIFPVLRKPRVEPAAHLLFKTLPLFHLFFETRFRGIGAGGDEHLFLPAFQHEKALPRARRFHAAAARLRHGVHVADEEHARSFRERQRRGEAGSVVVIAADDHDRPAPLRKGAHALVKEFFRLRGREIGIVNVPRDEHGVHAFALRDLRDFREHFPLFGEAFSAVRALSDMPIRRMQKLHLFFIRFPFFPSTTSCGAEIFFRKALLFSDLYYIIIKR